MKVIYPDATSSRGRQNSLQDSWRPSIWGDGDMGYQDLNMDYASWHPALRRSGIASNPSQTCCTDLGDGATILESRGRLLRRITQEIDGRMGHSESTVIAFTCIAKNQNHGHQHVAILDGCVHDVRETERWAYPNIPPPKPFSLSWGMGARRTEFGTHAGRMC